MTQLSSRINARSDEFKAKSDDMAALVADLKTKLARIELGGGPVALERHLSRGNYSHVNGLKSCSMQVRPF